MYPEFQASILTLLLLFLPFTTALPPFTKLNPRLSSYHQGTHHMECDIPASDSECYQRYHHLCDLGGLPSYGMSKIKCERDGCRCVTNRDIVPRDVPIEDSEDDLSEVTSKDLKDRGEIEGRSHGSMWCPMPDEISECWVRFHGLCEQRGFLPGESVADIVCGWDQCVCSHI